MTRQAANSDQAPAALGPYSQAIVAGGFVFCSGTAGIDPATGESREGIEAQTEQALTNLSAVLEAAGASMADLVKGAPKGEGVSTAGTFRPRQCDAPARTSGVHRRHRRASRVTSPT